MKNAVPIFLLLIFLFSTVGVIASSYCCNMQKEQSCCTKANKDCCEKEVKFFKISDEYVSSSPQQPVKTTSIIISERLIYISSLSYSTGFCCNLSIDDPPDLPFAVLPFIQSFRI